MPDFKNILIQKQCFFSTCIHNIFEHQNKLKFFFGKIKQKKLCTQNSFLYIYDNTS